MAPNSILNVFNTNVAPSGVIPPSYTSVYSVDVGAGLPTASNLVRVPEQDNFTRRGQLGEFDQKIAKIDQEIKNIEESKAYKKGTGASYQAQTQRREQLLRQKKELQVQCSQIEKNLRREQVLARINSLEMEMMEGKYADTSELSRLKKELHELNRPDIKPQLSGETTSLSNKNTSSVKAETDVVTETSPASVEKTKVKPSEIKPEGEKVKLTEEEKLAKTVATTKENLKDVEAEIKKAEAELEKATTETAKKEAEKRLSQLKDTEKALKQKLSKLDGYWKHVKTKMKKTWESPGKEMKSTWETLQKDWKGLSRTSKTVAGVAAGLAAVYTLGNILFGGGTQQNEY